MNDLWVPITAMLCVTAVIVVNVVFSARHKKLIQDTLQRQLDNGGSLTPELVKQLGGEPSSKQRDLRRGLAFMGIGLACFVSGWLISDANVGAAFGVFPLFLGIALLVASRLNADG